RDVGHDVAQHQGVGGQHAAGGGGEAADHHVEELGGGHGGDVRLDHQRGLGLAQEDVGAGGQGLRPGGLEGALHDPGDALDDGLHDAEVVEHGHQGGQEDDGGEHVEGEEG